MAFPVPPPRFASTGLAGRILSRNAEIDVDLGVIRRITRGSKYNRTETALERGAALTVHRQRVPEVVTIEIVVSNKEPVFGALIAQQWELEHASKTLDRLREAQAWDSELRIWTGTQYLRTPAGIQVWVLDDIGGPTNEGVENLNGPWGSLRATLTFGESPRFATQFTSAVNNVDPSLADVVGGSVERGRQSTTTVPDDVAAEIAGKIWPPI